MKTCIVSIGLIFDIVGALLVWRYGLPEEVNRFGEPIVEGPPDEEEVAKAEKYKTWATVGIIFLILGFALQLFGNLMH